MSKPQGTQPTGEDRIFTPANVVTLVRICLVPVFVVAILSPWPSWFPWWPGAEAAKPWIAAAIFIFLAATDGVDGYLARSRNEVTTFGKFIDPLADKILVTAALISLVELGCLPSWVVLIIITREFIVSGVRMLAASKGTVIAASWYGKAKTVFQIIAIVLFIIKDALSAQLPQDFSNPLYVFSWIIMLIAVVLTIFSMCDYLFSAKEFLGFDVVSSADSTKEKVSDVTGQNDTSHSGSRVVYGKGEAARALETALECQTLSADKLTNVAEAVIAEALASKKTLATAESLTAGKICAALTSVSGSSGAVRGGFCTYTNEMKQSMVGVSEETLVKFGAVSVQTAFEMAQGACENTGASLAVSATGIAGPLSDESGKPVGTVCIGVCVGDSCAAREFMFSGSREDIRNLTVLNALHVLQAAL